MFVYTIISALTIERRSESFTYLRYSDGVRLKWDDALSVYVTIDQTYMKQVSGLCGTYTNKLDGIEKKTLSFCLDLNEILHV